MTIVIADSGGTKCDWRIVSPEVSMAFRTRGISPIHQSKEEIIQLWKKELLPQFSSCKTVEGVYFYGSGCLPHTLDKVQEAIATLFANAVNISVESDLTGAARALFGKTEGIACILGTGANSGFFQKGVLVRQTPPLGYILGDEGSGAYLGKCLLNGLYKGRFPYELRALFEQEMQLSYSDVIDRVYQQALPNRFLASLTPFIKRATEHFPHLRDMVVEAFITFFTNNVLPYHRKDVPIGCVGGVAHAFANELVEAALNCRLKLGGILKSPADALVQYHSSDLRNLAV